MRSDQNNSFKKVVSSSPLKSHLKPRK